MSKDFSLSKKQYAHLIKSIEGSLRKHVSGGGTGDFSPPDTIPYIHDVQFWVDDDNFSGGGFFSSVGKAFKNVYKSLKNSGVIDKAKDMALKKGRELGGQAIEAGAKYAEKKASEKGLDISKITQKAAETAHEHLHDAEGFVSKKLDEGQSAFEKKADVSGSGMYQVGAIRGGAMYQSGMNGGSAYGTSYVRAPEHTPGIPKNAFRVSSTNHLR